ncbi:hypothetical protein BV898_01128 [Hypsibius exemplaris]|uniref:HTH CENPB-type domain-containing protein n=1 Tax=Hypsibius exemplaris TaxID=2072580 RepID=A0A1W0XBT5_HYPEX|nr:hypothetical protein BV898_01128 [Hypsibius exemplaris]
MEKKSDIREGAWNYENMAFGAGTLVLNAEFPDEPILPGQFSPNDMDLPCLPSIPSNSVVYSGGYAAVADDTSNDFATASLRIDCGSSSPSPDVSHEATVVPFSPRTSKVVTGRKIKVASGETPTKRVSNAYTAVQKTEYVDAYRKECSESGPYSQRLFARKNNLSHARFSAWCKEYDHLKALDTQKQNFTRVRTAQPRYPVLEARVLEWVNMQRYDCHTDPTVKNIQTAACSIAIQLGMSDFKASNTWIERFKKRSGLDQPYKASPPLEELSRPSSPCSINDPAVFMLTDSISPDEVITTDFQDILIDCILQDFLRRSSSSLASPIECAGLGLSHSSSASLVDGTSEKLKEIRIDRGELDFDDDVVSDGSGVFSSSSSAASRAAPSESSRQSSRKMYSPKQRMKYLRLYRTERNAVGRQFSVRMFCLQYGISRTRMTAWLKQEEANHV